MLYYRAVESAIPFTVTVLEFGGDQTWESTIPILVAVLEPGNRPIPLLVAAQEAL